MNKLICKTLLVLFWLNISVFTSQAQSNKELFNKPGKYIIHSRLNKCPGTDITVLSNNLRNIAEWIPQNDFLFNPLKGLDVEVDFCGNLCEGKDYYQIFRYGIESELVCSFYYFYLDNGIFKIANDWLAQTAIIFINQPFTNLANRYEERDFEEGDPQFEIPINEAHKQLKKYYSIPQLGKELAPGVKLFRNNQLVISNPERPDYWIPVTVKEIMEVMLNYYQLRKENDKVIQKQLAQKLANLGVKVDESVKIPNVYDMILKEYESFSSAELEQHAYSAPIYGISGINAKGEGNQVVRVNPECWDRKLPVTSIQFISTDLGFRSAGNQEVVERENGLIDYKSMFYNNLPVEKMGILIQKK